MPIKSPTNNGILPANARASDVASKAVNDILKVQQTRHMSALRVQGYQGILYNRVKQGPKCTCQASDTHLNTRLNQSGKASPAAINSLLTGDSNFGITPYGSRAIPVDPTTDGQTSPFSPVNKQLGVFDVSAVDVSTYTHATVPTDPSFADSGPINPDFNINDLMAGFNNANMGYSDTACAICFGTGFVGGYVAFNTYRKVYPANHEGFILNDSALDIATQPWSCTSASTVNLNALFPRGACGVDSFKLFNGKKAVPANFTVDGHSISSAFQLLAYCDGRMHTIGIEFTGNTIWTHLELQFAVSTDSPYFEFPKLTQGSDVNMLDKIEPFQIIVGPNVPSLQTEDIIVESTFGKALIVQNSNLWNTRNRNTLGWECTVRVAQPQEMFTILPKRGKVPTKTPTTVTAHSNKPGNRT